MTTTTPLNYNYSDFVEPSKYASIVKELVANAPNISFDESTKHIIIKKKDMEYRVTHPEEVEEMMRYMFLVNNFICRQYRRRKHILKSTRIINEKG